ncbi:MAG TPA: AAA family ATPase [Microthrixaceae bacterium]|nr:AAA family ATPase [Microthrixaceae bacterium]
MLIAAPGTGKTFSLDAAREAWQRSGQRVMGCALSATAAHQLQAGSGIASSTIEALRVDLARGNARLDAASVLVIDEAGMVGTRSLAALIETADRAGAKVVLVGDTRQLPEIDAGGLLRRLEQVHPVIRLDQNRRQQVGWERRALDAFRRDDVDAALELFHQHEALVVGPNADVVREVMVNDWWRHRSAGDRAVMMASRNIDVDDLNRRARAHLAGAHQLHGQALIVEHRPYQVGDAVVCLRNNRRRGLRNGTVGEVVTIDHEQRSMLIDTAEGLRRIQASYLDQGWIRHGYAVTIHKAQGITADHGLLLASDRTYNEAGYVGISRGTRSNRIYAVSDQAHDPEHQPHGRMAPDDRDPFDPVVDALKTSAAKDLATPPVPELDDGIDLW